MKMILFAIIFLAVIFVAAMATSLPAVLLFGTFAKGVLGI